MYVPYIPINNYLFQNTDRKMVYNAAERAQRIEEYVQKYGLSARKKMVLTSNEAVKQAVIANLGVSIMPLIGIRNELKNGQLHCFSSMDELHTSVHLLLSEF